MYAEDSFFTLGWGGRLGLLALTCVLSGAMIWLAGRLRMARWWARGGMALGLFWGFVWLSPQIYYGYYLLIFEGLPVQGVIKAPPSPGVVAGMLGFQGPATLSAHGQGLLGWGMIAAALWRRKP